jgi:hypothetical protein
MPLIKYIKQPLSPSLGQYTDAELRKIEASIFNLVESADALQTEVDAVELEVDALQEEAYSISVMKPSDTSTASDNTPNADPHLVLPLTAGVWEIQSGCIASCAISGVAFAYNHIFSATIQSPPVNCGMVGSVASVYDSVVGPGATAFTFVLVAVTRKTVTFNFIIEVLTPGNLVLFWSQGASNATPVILHKGSYLRARRLI